MTGRDNARPGAGAEDLGKQQAAGNCHERGRNQVIEPHTETGVACQCRARHGRHAARHDCEQLRAAQLSDKRFQRGRQLALTEKDRRHSGEGLELAHAEKPLKYGAQTDHDPAHHPQVIQNRDERGHIDDRRQYAECEYEAGIPEQLVHFGSDEPAEQKFHSLVAIPDHLVDPRGRAAQRNATPGHKEHQRADGDLRGQCG